MAYSPLIIGDKTADIPIVQGGMGIGVSLGNLAGHVALAGGVGIISTAQIGYKEADFESNPHSANLTAIEKEFKKAREISPDGIIGFNIMMALSHYEEYVKKACQVGADIIISGAGLPTELPEYVKGCDTKIAPIVSSDRAAKILLKMWDRRYNRTADMVVIEGPKAGGHLGFSKEELDTVTDETFSEEIKRIIATVNEYGDKYGVHIPVVVAGGISGPYEVKKAFDLGASGVQVASRFVASYECDAHINFKNKYINSSKEDIMIIKSPVGMPGRAIMNEFARKVMAGGKETVTKCFGCLKKCNPKEIPYCITKALITSVSGDTENGLVFCGADTYKINSVENVKTIIDYLMN